MAYNVTVLDSRREHATVMMAPRSAPEVVAHPVVTNHQRRVDWPRHAIATGSVERHRVLSAHVRDPMESTQRFVNRFLEPPVYSRHLDRGTGTLYTAVYRPVSKTVSYLWPGTALEGDLGARASRVARRDGARVSAGALLGRSPASPAVFVAVAEPAGREVD